MSKFTEKDGKIYNAFKTTKKMTKERFGNTIT